MSKLFRFKEWLTLPVAARHLSTVFEEDVTEADLLHLALAGKLRLSVCFVNQAVAIPGKIIPIDEAEYLEVPSLHGTGMVRLYGGPSLQSRGQDSHIIQLEKSVVSLSGIYDLPMIGNERLDIENKYQQLTGGPNVTSQGLYGAFVEGREGQIFQLQEDFDDNKYKSGSRAHLEEVKQHIALNNLAEAEAEVRLNQYKEEREKFREERKSQPIWENYYPAGGLPPEDCALVVRTGAMREFEEFAAGTTAIHNSPEPTSRRNHQHEIILAVIAALQYDPKRIPDGGKAKIKEACLTRLYWFTPDSFAHAWQAGLSAGLFRMANHERYSPNKS